MMGCASIVRVLVLLSTLVNVAYLQPTGERNGSPPAEIAKVSELRHKLQRLHDILQKYKDEDGLEVPLKQPSPSNPPINITQADKSKAGNDVTGGDVNTNHTAGVSTRTFIKLARKGRKKTAIASHPKQRAVSAEDMDRKASRRRSGGRKDPDEEDLMQLGKTTKTKRQGDDSIQILAKALAQLTNDAVSKRTSKATDGEKAKEEVGVSGLKAKTHLQDNAEMSTLEDSLLEELTRLLENENRDGDHHSGKQEPPLPLFHPEDKSEANPKTEVHTKIPQKEYYTLGDNPNLMSSSKMSDNVRDDNDDNTHDSHSEVGDDDDNDDDNNDDNNDDNDDADKDEEELVKYLEDAGYTLSDAKDEKPVTREEIIEKVEGRLMEDIELANSVGVSANDLIQDLEDKAFREALIRRLQRLLESRR